MAIQAVITGDIVRSTSLTAKEEKTLTAILTGLFEQYKFELYRGDSFQAYITKPQQALRLALLCRSAAIALSTKTKLETDIRISIGLGIVNMPVNDLRTAKGEAFLLSGRQFDEITLSDERLAMTTANPLGNIGLKVISAFINSIFISMTDKQAEVVFELLNGELQQDIAQKLNKTKSTIHQRLTSARWPEIENMLLQYENLVNLLP